MSALEAAWDFQNGSLINIKNPKEANSPSPWSEVSWTETQPSEILGNETLHYRFVTWSPERQDIQGNQGNTVTLTEKDRSILTCVTLHHQDNDC